MQRKRRRLLQRGSGLVFKPQESRNTAQHVCNQKDGMVHVSTSQTGRHCARQQEVMVSSPRKSGSAVHFSLACLERGDTGTGVKTARLQVPQEQYEHTTRSRNSVTSAKGSSSPKPYEVRSSGKTSRQQARNLQSLAAKASQ